MKGSVLRPLAICLVGLTVLAWVARHLVDRNGGYFSNNEFGDWLAVVGSVTGACLVAGVALVRRPVGRGILLGTVLAVGVVGVVLVGEALMTSA